MYDIDTLAANLRAARAKKKYSQDDLARESHVLRQSIQKYETGETDPGAKNLMALADALGVSPNELLGWG